MSKIHNTKQRMPLILAPSQEQDWLMGTTLNDEQVELIAEKV